MAPILEDSNMARFAPLTLGSLAIPAARGSAVSFIGGSAADKVAYKIPAAEAVRRIAALGEAAKALPVILAAPIGFADGMRYLVRRTPGEILSVFIYD